VEAGKAMIITQTPYRISFFGGGTDYPTWVQKHGGAVLSTTINKYCYLTCRQLPPFFNHKHRFVWSQIELVNDLADTRHPVIRTVLQYFNQQEGLEIHNVGDLPAQSGIGSSSSFTVGLLHTLFALRGEIKSKQELAELAIHIEQNVLHEAVGCQDQVAAAFGGFNRIEFFRDGQFAVRPVIVVKDRLNELNRNLMMFFTGVSRMASVVAQSKMDNFTRREAELTRMREMVDEGQMILQQPTTSLDEFGKLLHESWQLKRQLSDKVSTSGIDDIYGKAMKSGALGGKILGAGGGGFMLFFVRPERQAQVRAALHGLTEIDFSFEQGGSQIVIYRPELALYRSAGLRLAKAN
jgi:D-glycero-alpha-D-manno-heptose-7-phosphate kinase